MCPALLFISSPWLPMQIRAHPMTCKGKKEFWVELRVCFHPYCLAVCMNACLSGCLSADMNSHVCMHTGYFVCCFVFVTRSLIWCLVDRPTIHARIHAGTHTRTYTHLPLCVRTLSPRPCEQNFSTSAVCLAARGLGEIPNHCRTPVLVSWSAS